MNKWRKFFPYFSFNSDIYLDNAATNMKLESVINAEAEFLRKINANPHSNDFDNAFKATTEIENCRKKVAKFIGISDEKEIVFTSGTTHSLNQIAFGLKKYLKKGMNVVLTETEHASNLLPWIVLSKELGFEIRYATLDINGLILVDKLQECIDKNTYITSFASCSNTMGAMNDIEKISAEIKRINSKTLISIDAAQSVAHISTDVIKWGVDFLSFSAHKLFGPFGLGVLWAKKDLLNQMDPIFYGGGNNHSITKNDFILSDVPYKFEAGTPNASAIYAFSKVFDFLNNEISLEDIYKEEVELKNYAKELAQDLDDDIEIYNINNDAPIILFNVNGVPSQDMGTYLSAKWNISVRTGTHCAKIFCDFKGCKTTVRASFSFLNTKEELKTLFNAIKESKKNWLDAIL